jgi:hypothetical protein
MGVPQQPARIVPGPRSLPACSHHDHITDVLLLRPSHSRRDSCHRRNAALRYWARGSLLGLGFRLLGLGFWLGAAGPRPHPVTSAQE